MKHKVLLVLLAGLAGAGGGWLFTETVLIDKTVAGPVPSPAIEALLGQRRPDFSLGSTTGAVLSVSDFDGQVLLINFWATWCKPCREEMPMLSALHERLSGQGFQVLGIALDDVRQARDFVAELDIRYPIMVGGVDVMATGVSYGNRAGMLPYSVLVDREGVIRWTKLGVLEMSDLDARIEALL